MSPADQERFVRSARRRSISSRISRSLDRDHWRSDVAAVVPRRPDGALVVLSFKASISATASYCVIIVASRHAPLQGPGSAVWN